MLEAAALMRFYEASGGTSWSRNEGWLDGPPCNATGNRWFGLICDGDSFVTQILMYSNHLTGTLASELGDLSKLTQLWLPTPDTSHRPHPRDLAGNFLSGTLPSQLGRLTVLTDLVLNGNSLSGTLPSSIGAWARLRSLVLNNNTLSGVLPTQLGQLRSITYLGVNANRFKGYLPTQVGQLAAVTELDADSNLHLSGTIPSQLARLTALEWFDLYKNALSGTMPPAIARLPLTRDLRIHSNRLSGTLPTELGARRPWYCYLTNAQCRLEGGGDEICATATTNRFACPLPPQLLNASGCGGRGLKCYEKGGLVQRRQLNESYAMS